MASFISAADIIAVAIEVEKRGRQFYLDVASKASNQGDKVFFTELAEEEVKHEQLFSAMIERIGGVPFPAGATDEEYLAYVRDLIDSHALFVPKQQQAMQESPIGMAIQMEKDTMLFFLSVVDLVPDSEKALVKACADEERKHLRRLAARSSAEV